MRKSTRQSETSVFRYLCAAAIITTMPAYQSVHVHSAAVYSVLTEGKEVHDTARLLAFSPSFVSKVVKKFTIYGSVDDRSRPGRPRSTLLQSDRLLVRQFVLDSKLLAKVGMLRANFKRSPWTAYRRLHEKGRRLF